jgi:hypothetical protein
MAGVSIRRWGLTKTGVEALGGEQAEPAEISKFGDLKD